MCLEDVDTLVVPELPLQTGPSTDTTETTMKTDGSSAASSGISDGQRTSTVTQDMGDGTLTPIEAQNALDPKMQEGS